MFSQNSLSPSLLRLGGIAGICVGVFILSFAFLSEMAGALFVAESVQGGSIESWLQNLLSHADLIRALMFLPILGFSSMLVVIFVLYQLIPKNSWQKNLALCGFLIGIPVIVSGFLSHLSLINQLIIQYVQSSSITEWMQASAIMGVDKFMFLNYLIGPFFVVLIGNTSIAWAALKSQTLPKWLCYWAMVAGVLIIPGMLSLIYPFLKVFSILGPLTMLWFLLVGIQLIKQSLLAKSQPLAPTARLATEVI